MAVDVTALAISVTSTGIKEASQQLGGLSTSANNAATRILALTEAMKKLQGSSTTLTQTMGSTAALTAALTALNNSLVILNQRTQQADTTQRRHNDSMREAHSLARGLSGSLGALWLSYGAFAGMAVGLAIGASLKGIVTVGKDVEHTLEGIRIRGNETTASVDKMRQAIFNLGTGVYGPQQVASAFETLVLAGLNAQQAMVSVNAAMNLAVIGGTTIEKAAQTLVSVGTAVGYTAEGFDRVGDVIAKTAALSMSSVTTLSEAFKSASSVNKLYGVTLEDIGTGLGILSNLGIQGSAAGTAMKNFYKELASGNEKVTSTLKAMGLTQASFKDSKGMFLPFVEVIATLDKGMKGLTESQQKLALANLTNERGLRLGVQALGEYNTKVGETSNALAEFQKAVTNSQGFAAIGAVAMSLTAKSQIDSMLNSLKVSFAETFTEMQPEIIAFTGRMKEIFKSEEFKESLKVIAQGFANLAIAVANNLPLITALVVGFTAVKSAMAIGVVLQGVAAGIAAIGPAFAAASAGALTFTAALGPIAILLGIVTAAVLLYNSAQEASNKHTKMAADYSEGYLNGLEQEANRLAKVNAELSKKKTLSEATAELDRAEARDKMNQLNRRAVDEAQNNLDNGTKWTGYTKIAQEKALADAKKKYAEDNRIAMEQENRIKEYSLRIDEKVKANAIANRNSKGGEGVLAVKPDTAKVNDAYNAAQITQMEVLKSARKEMTAFEEQQNALFKAGEIGKLQFIEEVQKKQVELFIKAQDARREQLRIAQSKGSQADVARITGEMSNAREDLDNKNTQNRINKEAAITKAVEDYTKLRIVKLEEEGNFAQAATLRWSSEHSAAFRQAEADAKAYGDVYPILYDRVNQLKDVQKEMVKSGLNREAIKEFNVAADAVRNSMKGIQTASEGNGIGAMFTAAVEASNKYQSSLEELRSKANAITDPKAQEEAAARLINLGETQRKLWEGVGESISNSLESAFGKGGKAAGDLVKVWATYNATEKKDANARVKGYGDAAGAAKNFFKEGTTGYKVLAAAEQAFRIIELLGIQKSVMATLAAAAQKALAYVPAVLMSFMASMGPWGLAAAGVAIAGVLGSMGGSGGSGGSPMSAKERQDAAGKGSVLGSPDENSESISRSLEILEKNSGLGLVHSGDMVKSLHTLVTGISGLSSLVVRTSDLNGGNVAGVKEGTTRTAAGNPAWGGPIGMVLAKIPVVGALITKLFGATTSIKDQGIQIGKNSLAGIDSVGLNAQSYADIETKKKFLGLTTSTKVSTQTGALPQEVSDQFTMAVKSMADSITAAANSLGLGGDAFTQKLKTFVVDIGSISIKGLSGDEIQKQFESIFSKLGDDMAKFGVDGLDKFQKVGEGYFETLARVANDLIQVKDVFAVMGQAFNATGMDAINVSESLIASAGGLEKLTTGAKFFVDNLLTEAQKMEPITKSVTDRLAELQMSELTSIELYAAKVRALDLTNTADQALFASLIELAPAFKESADYATKLAEGTVTLTKAQQKAKDILDKQRELDIRLVEAQGNSLEAVAMRRSDELAALQKLAPALANTQAAIYALSDASDTLSTKRSLELRLMEASGDTAGALARKREDETKALAKANPSLVGYLESIYAAEDAAKAATVVRENEAKVSEAASKQLQASYEKESKSIQDVIDKFKKFSDTLKKFKESLLTGDLSTLSPEQKYLKTKNNFLAQSALAAGGDEKALEGLQDVAQEFLDSSRGYNASTEAYARDFDLVQMALDNGIAAADKQADAGVAQLAVMNKQYEVMMGLKDVTVSFLDAFNNYASTKAGASAVAITDAYKTALGRSPEQAGMDYWQSMVSKGSLDITGAVSGISNSPEAKINALYKDILGRNSDKAGMDYWMNAYNSGQSLDAIAANMRTSKEYDGSHYDGLDSVPFDGYTAKMHQGERIQTRASVQANDKASAESAIVMKELLQGISEMKEEVAVSNLQRGAIAEQQASQLQEVVIGLSTVARKVAAIESK